MESMRDIRIRLNSISSTKQITESMRLVSTSKLQKAKLRAEANRPYLEQAAGIMERISNSPLVRRHEYITGRKAETSLIIMITSDRGLCGGYNVNVEKEALSLAKSLGKTQIITIGAKGRDYCRRRGKTVLRALKGLSETPFFEDAQIIGTYALNMFDDKTVDQIYLVYTEYHNMLSQIPRTVRLLPIDPTENTRSEANTDDRIHYEPGEERFLKHASSTYICSMLYGAMLESSVSEQSMRITSMDAAVKNSSKIIDSLTLQYNQIRQGTITQEIAEIVGGANAVSQRE